MNQYEIYDLVGLRVDGRTSEEHRPLQHRIGVTAQTDGSAYLEHGLNKVLAMIVGPHEPYKKNIDLSSEDECRVSCAVHYAAFSGPERKKRKQVSN